MAGKVFSSSQHSIGPSAADVGGHKIANLLRVFTERTSVDDGIGGIRIHVGYGKKIPMHADSASFLRSDASEGLGIVQFSGSAEGHGMGKYCRSVKAHGDAALEISRDQQGQFGILLQTIEEYGRLIGLVPV